MQLTHGASVLVTDGRKALYLRNEGDGEFANLRLVRKWESPVAADRELRSDAPGRVFGSRGGATRRSAYDEGDLHDQEEAEFAEHIAEFVNAQAAGEAPQLVVVAPPRTLGVLRKHLRRDVAGRLAAEIPKDLVKHPIPEIERLLTAHRERA
jgi:protein required for attachment to host cells